LPGQHIFQTAWRDIHQAKPGPSKAPTRPAFPRGHPPGQGPQKHPPGQVSQRTLFSLLRSQGFRKPKRWSSQTDEDFGGQIFKFLARSAHLSNSLERHPPGKTRALKSTHQAQLSRGGTHQARARKSTHQARSPKGPSSPCSGAPSSASRTLSASGPPGQQALATYWKSTRQGPPGQGPEQDAFPSFTDLLRGSSPPRPPPHRGHGTESGQRHPPSHQARGHQVSAGFKLRGKVASRPGRPRSAPPSAPSLKTFLPDAVNTES
jgi:hypothetical protein